MWNMFFKNTETCQKEREICAYRMPKSAQKPPIYVPKKTEYWECLYGVLIVCLNWFVLLIDYVLMIIRFVCFEKKKNSENNVRL